MHEQALQTEKRLGIKHDEKCPICKQQEKVKKSVANKTVSSTKASSKFNNILSDPKVSAGRG